MCLCHLAKSNNMKLGTDPWKHGQTFSDFAWTSVLRKCSSMEIYEPYVQTYHNICFVKCSTQNIRYFLDSSGENYYQGYPARFHWDIKAWK